MVGEANSKEAASRGKAVQALKTTQNQPTHPDLTQQRSEF